MVRFDPKLEKKPLLPAGPLRIFVGIGLLLVLYSLMQDVDMLSRAVAPADDGFEDTNVADAGSATEVIPRVIPVQENFTEIPGIYDSAFDDYKFPEDVHNLGPEMGIIYYITAKLTTLSDDQLREQSLRMPDDVHFNDVIQAPHTYRGEVLTIFGQVRTLFKQDLPPNNPTGLAYNYHGQIQDRDGNLYSYQTLDPRGVKVDDLVVMSGIFMKRWCYENRGGMWQWTPLIFSRQLNKVEQPEQHAGDFIQFGIMGVFVVGLLVVYYVRRSSVAATAYSAANASPARRSSRTFEASKVRMRKRVQVADTESDGDRAAEPDSDPD